MRTLILLILLDVCPQWRDDFFRFVYTGEARPLFLHHLVRCRHCRSAFNSFLDLQILMNREIAALQLATIRLRQFMAT